MSFYTHVIGGSNWGKLVSYGRNLDLLKLKGSCHVLNYLMRLSISFRNRVQSSTELIVRYKYSAYNLIFEVTFRGISFTKHRKRRGAKLFPGVHQMIQQRGSC